MLPIALHAYNRSFTNNQQTSRRWSHNNHRAAIAARAALSMESQPLLVATVPSTS
jgi:hypothetical protein